MQAKHLVGMALLSVISVILVSMRSSPARATTFVMMDDERLLETSAVVLIGTVTAIESAAPQPGGPISTYVHVQPSRIIKGELGGAALVLREPGGTVAGRTEWVFGAPEFWVGERSLLFLSRNADGTLQTTSLSMGKFTIGVDLTGQATATRDFGYGATVLMPSTGQVIEALTEPRSLSPLVRHLRDLAHRQTPATRRLALQPQPPELASALTEVHEAFTFMSDPPGRWIEPDSGLPVNYLIDSTGDATLGFAASRAAVDAALGAWTNVSSANLVLGDGGTTAPSAFAGCTVNHITFNDPFNEVTDPSGCGGILAIGGYCVTPQTTVVNGRTFNRIMVAKVMVNNGWGDCAAWTQCNLAEVLTHEIGHTIGLGHSEDGNATMAATAHFDGRCAGLGSDDIAAVNFIYPRPAGVSPTPTRTPTPLSTTPTWAPTWTPTNTRPPAPTATAAQSRPANDLCTAATLVSSVSYATSMMTSAATVDASDPMPQCGNRSRNKSVWYRFTAPTSGTVKANTFGSKYDTILSTYMGLCGSLAPLSGGCNDNASATQSQVAFTASAGKTYYFMVSASTSAGGSLAFNLTFQAAATPVPTRTRVAANTLPTPTAASRGR